MGQRCCNFVQLAIEIDPALVRLDWSFLLNLIQVTNGHELVWTLFLLGLVGLSVVSQVVDGLKMTLKHGEAVLESPVCNLHFSNNFQNRVLIAC